MTDRCFSSSAFDNRGGDIYLRDPPATINGVDVCVEQTKPANLWRVRRTCRGVDKTLVIYADNLETKEVADVALDLLKEN